MAAWGLRPGRLPAGAGWAACSRPGWTLSPHLMQPGLSDAGARLLLTRCLLPGCCAGCPSGRPAMTALDLACGSWAPQPGVALGAGAAPRSRPWTAMRSQPERNIPELQGRECCGGRSGATRPWPLGGRAISTWCWSPTTCGARCLPRVVEAVAPGGWLVYETFALGQEQFGRPRNPDFLLRPGELLALCRASSMCWPTKTASSTAPASSALPRAPWRPP